MSDPVVAAQEHLLKVELRLVLRELGRAARHYDGGFVMRGLSWDVHSCASSTHLDGPSISQFDGEFAKRVLKQLSTVRECFAKKLDYPERAHDLALLEQAEEAAEAYAAAVRLMQQDVTITMDNDEYNAYRSVVDHTPDPGATGLALTAAMKANGLLK